MHLAVCARRLIVLRDLIALWQIGIEVVLAREHRRVGNLASEREPELDRPLDRAPVHDGERTREAEADRACLRVLARAEAHRAAAEHLRPRLQLDVDLEPDHGLPAHRSRSGTVSKASARSRAWPTANSPFSPNCRPISCSPTGSPSERPHGIERPGSPARHEGIVSRSHAYIASGSADLSPIGNATVGEVGVTIASQRASASRCSRISSVRTFWAWP